MKNSTVSTWFIVELRKLVTGFQLQGINCYWLGIGRYKERYQHHKGKARHQYHTITAQHHSTTRKQRNQAPDKQNKAPQLVPVMVPVKPKPQQPASQRASTRETGAKLVPAQVQKSGHKRKNKKGKRGSTVSTKAQPAKHKTSKASTKTSKASPQISTEFPHQNNSLESAQPDPEQRKREKKKVAQPEQTTQPDEEKIHSQHSKPTKASNSQAGEINNPRETTKSSQHHVKYTSNQTKGYN